MRRAIYKMRRARWAVGPALERRAPGTSQRQRQWRLQRAVAAAARNCSYLCTAAPSSTVQVYDRCRTVDRQGVLSRVASQVMRLRCSKGMKVSAFYGNFHMRGTDLMALPNVDVDKAFACELTFEEQAISTNAICVQCALLYAYPLDRPVALGCTLTRHYSPTRSAIMRDSAMGPEARRSQRIGCTSVLRARRYTTSGGERRIRVHTINLPVTTQVRRSAAGVPIGRVRVGTH